MSNIAIEKFEAEYHAADGWRPCQVVGVNVGDRFGTGEFIIITADDDGVLWTGTAASVRPPQPHHPRRPSA